MAKNSHKMACLLAAYSSFAGFTGGEVPLVNTKKSGLDLPTKGVKGLSNQELNANFKPKNKRKKRRKRLKK